MNVADMELPVDVYILEKIPATSRQRLLVEEELHNERG